MVCVENKNAWKKDISYKMPLVHTMEKDGPGVWYVVHLTAAQCDTEAKIINCINMLHMLGNKMYCRDPCGIDTIDYLHQQQGELTNIRTALEMLKFTYSFHEHVNQKKGKSSASWADVKSFYYDGVTECVGSCKPSKKRRLVEADTWSKRVRVFRK